MLSLKVLLFLLLLKEKGKKENEREKKNRLISRSQVSFSTTSSEL